MEIFIGSDYRGFEKKNMLINFLKASGHEVHDEGSYNYIEGDSFIDPAVAVSKNVRENLGSLGILICGSAHGVTIQANRFKGIRAAHCETVESAKLAKEHDDANVLCMAAMFSSEEDMKQITSTFLATNFDNLERRVARINKLDEREDYA